MMKSKIFASVFLLGCISFPLVSSAQVWSDPTALPPSNNVDAPINVSAHDQTKLGSLIIGNGLGVTNGNLVVANGSTTASQFCLGGVCISSWPSVTNNYTTSTNVAMCVNNSWTCASASGSSRELAASLPSAQANFNSTVARANAVAACNSQGNQFIGYKITTEGTSCGHTYNTAYWNGSTWAWYNDLCGGKVVVVSSIYCKNTVTIPSDVLQ